MKFEEFKEVMGWVVLGIKTALKAIFNLFKKLFYLIKKGINCIVAFAHRERKPSKKAYAVRTVIGICLLTVGFLTALYPFASSVVKSNTINRTVREFDEQIKAIEQAQVSTTATGDNDTDKTARTNKSATPTYRPLSELYEWMRNYNVDLFENGQEISDEEDFTGFDIDLAEFGLKNDVIGVIEIPKINQELPLIMNAEYDVMFDGASVLGQTSLPIGGVNTNCVIASHRGSVSAELFRNIDKLEIGDEVYIRTPWEKMTYRVVETEIVNKNAVSEIKIQQGRDLVTLLSCHPYQINNRRYLVYCERAD